MTHHDTDDLQLKIVDEGGTPHVEQDFEDEQQIDYFEWERDPIFDDPEFQRLCAIENELELKHRAAQDERIKYALTWSRPTNPN